MSEQKDKNRETESKIKEFKMTDEWFLHAV